MRVKVVTVMRWYAQDEVNQEDSEQNDVDGMKKGATGAYVKQRVSPQVCVFPRHLDFWYFTVSFDHQWLILSLFTKCRQKRTFRCKVIAKNVYGVRPTSWI